MRLLALVTGVSLLLGAAASGDERPALGSCRLTHCLVSLLDEVDVPAQEAGVLISIEAREGMTVQQGMLLGQIDDQPVRHQKRIADLEREAAQAKAASDVSVRHARAQSDVARADAQAVGSVNTRTPGTISQSEQRKKDLEFKTSELRIEQAQLEQRVAEISSQSKAAEADAAQTSIDRRRVRAPLDGLIVEVHKRPGEWLHPGDRVLKIVRMDRLRVDGFVKASEFDAGELDNRPVIVEAKLARGRIEKFEGKLTFVDPQIEAGGEFRVRAEVVNRSEVRQWLLRPGLKVEMTVSLDDDVAQAASSPPRGKNRP